MMYKLLIAASLSFTPAAFALQVPVTSDHMPNSHTLECLKAPTRDCSFQAAFKTVIDEEFGIERSKVLIGVARSMIAIGQSEQAIQTLMLALDEARSVNLSIVVQEKITTIAPLLAEAGDTAGGLALVQELRSDTIKDQTLINVAEKLIIAGHIADARVALGQVKNEVRAFWRFLGLLTQAPKNALSELEFETIKASVQAIEKVDQKYRALIRLAVIADRIGRVDDRNTLIGQADELFVAVVGLQVRAEVTGERARLMFEGGMDDAFVSSSFDMAKLHGSRVRGQDNRSDLARNIGPIEATSGNIETALKRLDVISEVSDQVAYITSLLVHNNSSVLIERVLKFLDEVTAVDGAYDRDLIRLTLLEGALSNQNIAVAKAIIETLEDDDNQALGLVLMAPMLE